MLVLVIVADAAKWDFHTFQEVVAELAHHIIVIEDVELQAQVD